MGRLIVSGSINMQNEIVEFDILELVDKTEDEKHEYFNGIAYKLVEARLNADYKILADYQILD